MSSENPSSCPSRCHPAARLLARPCRPAHGATLHHWRWRGLLTDYLASQAPDGGSDPARPAILLCHGFGAFGGGCALRSVLSRALCRAACWDHQSHQLVRCAATRPSWEACCQARMLASLHAGAAGRPA